MSLFPKFEKRQESFMQMVGMDFNTLIRPLADQCLKNTGPLLYTKHPHLMWLQYRFVAKDFEADSYLFSGTVPGNDCHRMLQDVASSSYGEFTSYHDILEAGYERKFIVKGWVYLATALGILDWFILEKSGLMFLFPSRYSIASEEIDRGIDLLFLEEGNDSALTLEDEEAI
jgi:hypothetical protein